MNKEEALSLLKCFKDNGVSRDKCIELYNFFRYNPEENSYTLTLTGGDTVLINRTELWDVVNTSDIREVYKKSVPHSEINIDEENITSTDFTKLRKETISYKTKLNAERNNFNKKLKDISQIEDFEQEIIRYLKKLKPITQECNNIVTNSNNDDILVVHLGDIHLGEISGEYKDTGFDMTIASKRFKKYADYIKKDIIQKGIKKVVIMCGGDICNNVTLLSKRLLQTSNRAVTTIMGVILFQHFILDIYSVCQNIVFTGVGSNEARYDNEFFEDELLITNCADYVIYNMLELLFQDYKTIKFLQGRNNEKIVQVNGQHILLTHGVGISKDVEKGVQQAISRYSVKGIDVRYVLLSHIHCARNSSYFARNGSMCGSNAYSNSTLNLQTRASQNVIYVSKNGDITPIAVDLENVDGITGYDISNEITKFDLRSRSKRPDLDEIQIA